MQSAKEQLGDKVNAAKRRFSAALSDIQRTFLEDLTFNDLTRDLLANTVYGPALRNAAAAEEYSRSVCVGAFLERSESCIKKWFFTFLAISESFPNEVRGESAAAWAKATAAGVITESMRESFSEFLPQLLATLDELVDEFVDEELLRQPYAAVLEPPASQDPVQKDTEIAVDFSDGMLAAEPPAAHVRRVALGVAQVSLADLNVPVGTSLKETKSAFIKLGAPARKLKDPRILEAADYKIKNPKCTYKEVSIKFFGTASRADSIRSWVNKRKPSDGME